MSILGRVKSWATRAASVWKDAPEWGPSWNVLATLLGASRTGITVTPQTALSLTAAYAAVNVISTDVASLPLKTYKRRRGGGRDDVTDHPVSLLLSGSPDGETTSMRWRQAWLGHALGWGNGLGEITFDGDGQPTGLYLLDPSTTKAERRPQDRRLFYRHSRGTLPPYRVIHLAGFGFDGLTGYSPIAMAREAVALGLAAEGFGAALFGQGARPSGVLTTDRVLKADAIENLRKSWESLHAGMDNAGRVAILEQGLKFQQLTINPEDAQFLATRQFQVVEIARLFRLPPHKIGDYSQSHMANIEASNLDYMTTTLMPWCEAIEQELNRKLFTEDERADGLYVEHDMKAFMRGDSAARASYYSIGVDKGWFSRNEVRKWENLNPIEGDGGDLYTVQAQMVPIDQIGKEPDPPMGPAPTPDPQPEPTDEGTKS